MGRWFFPLLAVVLGAVAAALAASGIGPLAAFVGGVLAVLALGMVLRPRLQPIAAAPGREPPEPNDDGLALALVDALPVPLLILTRTGRIQHANPAAHAVLPRLQAGAHFAHIIRAPAFVEAVAATLADGGERSFRFTAYEGNDRYYEARVGMLPPDRGLGPDAAAIVRVDDRTQTHRSEQLRSDFIANASHELRTPLASIIGYIETLQNHAREDSEARERFLDIMAREAGRMQRLVDDLMSLSRIEMTEHVRPVENWSLNRIAADTAAALQPLARQQGVTLDIELPPDGAMVRGDRDQLYQVFLNLIDNAMKYGGAGTTIHACAAGPSKAYPNRVGVTVEDDGPGIAREHVHRLTERFYRVNVSSSRNKGGTGLGLAIVKHILNRHQGRLEIVSTPGEGSRFTVWMPRAEPDRADHDLPGQDRDGQDRADAVENPVAVTHRHAAGE